LPFSGRGLVLEILRGGADITTILYHPYSSVSMLLVGHHLGAR